MRGFLGLVILGGLFCAYWFGAAGVMRAAPAQLAARGVQVDALDVAGFPAAFAISLDQPALPARGWQADWASLTLPSYWPFSATGTLSGQQSFTWRGGNWHLSGNEMPLSFALSPSLKIRRAAVVGNAMTLTGPARAELASFSLSLEPLESAQDYRLALDMTGLILPLLGQTLEEISLRADLHYAAPLRLTARGPVADITIEEARMTNGASQAHVTGQLTRNAAGLWDGTVTLTMTNWQPVLVALQQSGLLPPEQAPMVMMMAQGMSDGDDLTLPLSVTGSILSLGPLPLLDLGRL